MSWRPASADVAKLQSQLHWAGCSRAQLQHKSAQMSAGTKPQSIWTQQAAGQMHSVDTKERLRAEHVAFTLRMVLCHASDGCACQMRRQSRGVFSPVLFWHHAGQQADCPCHHWGCHTGARQAAAAALDLAANDVSPISHNIRLHTKSSRLGRQHGRAAEHWGRMAAHAGYSCCQIQRGTSCHLLPARCAVRCCVAQTFVPH